MNLRLCVAILLFLTSCASPNMQYTTEHEFVEEWGWNKEKKRVEKNQKVSVSWKTK